MSHSLLHLFILDNSPGGLGEVGECNMLLAWGSKSQILVSEAPGNVWSLAQVSEDKGWGQKGQVSGRSISLGQATGDR